MSRSAVTLTCTSFVGGAVLIVIVGVEHDANSAIATHAIIQIFFIII